MTKRQKLKQPSGGFSVVTLLVLFVVIAAIGAGGYWLWHKNHSKTANKTTKPHHVSKTTKAITLKTYTNDEYKFSFQYPSTWKLTTDLEDIGRGQKEGRVFVTSPDGTQVHFDPNLGGKGGECAGYDDTYTTRTCSTLAILTVEELLNGSTNAVYFCHFSLTNALDDGGETVYYIGIESNLPEPVEIGSTLGNFLLPRNIIDTRAGEVNIYVEGKDDSQSDSPAFFDTNEAKEATPILKSFKLLE
jgi:uncharacterized protein (UPF0333 family)